MLRRRVSLSEESEDITVVGRASSARSCASLSEVESRKSAAEPWGMARSATERNCRAAPYGFPAAEKEQAPDGRSLSGAYPGHTPRRSVLTYPSDSRARRPRDLRERGASFQGG